VDRTKFVNYFPQFGKTPASAVTPQCAVCVLRCVSRDNNHRGSGSASGSGVSDDGEWDVVPPELTCTYTNRRSTERLARNKSQGTHAEAEAGARCAVCGAPCGPVRVWYCHLPLPLPLRANCKLRLSPTATAAGGHLHPLPLRTRGRGDPGDIRAGGEGRVSVYFLIRYKYKSSSALLEHVV
jgi:hypothetical protein